MDISRLDLVTLASLAGEAASRLVLERLRAAGHNGVRVSHGYVFQRLLVEEPTVGELAEALGMTQQGASKHVIQLEESGWAERFDDPADRRVRRVRLTDAGRRLIQDARGIRAELDDAVATRVGAQALEAARSALAELLDLADPEQRARHRRVPLPDHDR